MEPVTGGQDIYMTTRVREDNETFVCGDPQGGSCASTYAIDCTNRSSTGQCRDYALQLAFIANIEEFTMLIEHSVRAANDEAVGATMANMNGYLLSCNGYWAHWGTQSNSFIVLLTTATTHTLHLMRCAATRSCQPKPVNAKTS